MFSDPQKNVDQFAVDPGMKVADLGSGAGFYSLALARTVGENGQIYAVDIQQDLLMKLKKEADSENLENIEIIWGNIEDPKGSQLKDDGVDRVILANVLFQTKDKEAAVKEAHRILKPKGTLLYIDWSDSFGGLGPAAHYLVSESQAKSIFEKVGFEHVRNIDAGDHHYGMIFKKV